MCRLKIVSVLGPEFREVWIIFGSGEGLKLSMQWGGLRLGQHLMESGWV